VLLARALVLLPLAGCTLFEDEPEACSVDASTELGVVFADERGNVSVLDENGEFPLISAPQGGFIALLAPRMKTEVTRCQVQISAALRDMTTNLVVGLEQRPVTLTRHSDGWAIPPDPAGLSDLANVAICPSSASTAIDGNPFQIEVKVIGLTTADSPSTTTIGIPSCNGSQYCQSECSQSF
jgi:hypothetical protein